MNLFKRKLNNSAVETKAPTSEWVNKGNTLREEHEYEKALECYEKALQIEPQDELVWLSKAEALAMCFRYEESSASCDKALEINDLNAEGWFLKSFTLEMLGQYEKALESCSKGLDIEPDNKMAWCNKGQYLYASGRLEEALESFSTALKIDPEGEYAREVNEKISKWLQREGLEDELVSKVLTYLKSGGYKEALGSYEESLEVDPRSVADSFSKDFALAHLANPEKMLEDYEKEKIENQPQIHIELSLKEFEFGKWAWVEVILTNNGTAPARDLSFDFPPEVKIKHMDISTEQLQQGGEEKAINLQVIPELLPGNQTNRLISLMPLKAGQLPLGVQTSYKDTWGEEHQKTITLWVSVSQAGRQLPSVPDYTLLWRLSSGDFADIYVAKRTRDAITVIIKIPKLTDEQTTLTAEFMRAADEWSKLVHPNIVKVYQYGDKPFPWIAMEYMEKGPLTRRIGNLSARESLQIGIRLVEAVTYARRLHITHRFVNPKNVLFDSVGTPKLTNWRIKNIMSKISGSTAIGRDVSAYSAPEQVTTKFGGADWRTDIYQLGVLLYEMLTGKTPFHGDKEEELVEKITKESPDEPSESNPAITKQLDSIILKCIAKNKGDRYQDGLSLKADLEWVIQTGGCEET